VHNGEPAWEEKVPAAQGRQKEGDVAPRILEKDPGGHWMQPLEV